MFDELEEKLDQKFEKLNKRLNLLEKIIKNMIGDPWDDKTITGEWPNQKCRLCNGSSSGYYDSQSFDHDETCPVSLATDLD